VNSSLYPLISETVARPVLFTDFSVREGVERFLHDSARFVGCCFRLCRFVRLGVREAAPVEILAASACPSAAARDDPRHLEQAGVLVEQAGVLVGVGCVRQHVGDIEGRDGARRTVPPRGGLRHLVALLDTGGRGHFGVQSS
jgi:hypothetical protein